MARMGRVEGNYMSKVETTNKKLIDRGTRLVAHLAAVDYDTACYALHEAMDAVAGTGSNHQGRSLAGRGGRGEPAKRPFECLQQRE